MKEIIIGAAMVVVLVFRICALFYALDNED